MAYFHERRVSQGQEFICLGWSPFTNARGEDRTLPMWSSDCSSCGEAFIALTAEEEMGSAKPGWWKVSTRCIRCWRSEVEAVR